MRMHSYASWRNNSFIVQATLAYYDSGPLTLRGIVCPFTAPIMAIRMKVVPITPIATLTGTGTLIHLLVLAQLR